MAQRFNPITGQIDNIAKTHNLDYINGLIEGGKSKVIERIETKDYKAVKYFICLRPNYGHPSFFDYTISLDGNDLMTNQFNQFLGFNGFLLTPTLENHQIILTLESLAVDFTYSIYSVKF